MDMNLSELWEIAEDRGDWLCYGSWGSQSQKDSASEEQQKQQGLNIW